MTNQLFNTNNILVVIRIFLGLTMASHGLARLYYNSVNEFGLFLESRAIPYGGLSAWGITLFDWIAGLLFALGYQVKNIGIVFIIILLSGIALVHIQNGWFVVGHSNGGIEYSMLLILCFILCIKKL